MTSTSQSPEGITAEARDRPMGTLGLLALWCLLQLPRLIAIPLIRDVHAGSESDAWMFPAILDIVVAVAAIPVAILLWRRRNWAAWTIGIVFFVVSIIDHADAVTAAFLSPTPQIFGGPGGPASARLVPALQAAFDVLALWALTRPRIRHWFGVGGA